VALKIYEKEKIKDI